MFKAIKETMAELSQWMVWCHSGYSQKDAAQFISVSRRQWESGEGYAFAIYDALSDTLAGSVALNGINRIHGEANLGYRVRRSRMGQGIGWRAARLVAQFGLKELGLSRIELLIPISNVPSRRLAERAGARAEGILRRRLVLQGQAHDARCIRCWKTIWKTASEARAPDETASPAQAESARGGFGLERRGKSVLDGRVRTALRVAGLLMALVVAAFWFFGGANTGWTKTSIMHTERDPVTEIDKPVYEKRFVPGVDFLGGGLVAAAMVAGVSFCFRKQSGKAGS